MRLEVERTSRQGQVSKNRGDEQVQSDTTLIKQSNWDDAVGKEQGLVVRNSIGYTVDVYKGECTKLHSTFIELKIHIHINQVIDKTLLLILWDKG